MRHVGTGNSLIFIYDNIFTENNTRSSALIIKMAEMILMSVRLILVIAKDPPKALTLYIQRLVQLNITSYYHLFFKLVMYLFLNRIYS